MATADTNTLDPVIDDIVLRRLIEQAFERDLIPRDTVEKMIQPALERLGFSCERPPSLALDAMVEDFKEHFGLELGVSDIRRIAGDWRTSPISFGRLPPGADRTLVGWDNAEPTELSIIAGPKQYDEAGGHIDTPQTRLRDGHTVYTGRSNFYCRYRGKHMLVSLTDEEVQINGESTWQWSVAVRWAERPRDASSFIEALSGRIEGQLISERRGKILSSTYLPTSLRTYRLEDLAFPAPIRGDVEDLITAFDEWQSPSCVVPHWGGALIGKPGMGKTTIGGVLMGRKKDRTTGLYIPAHDLTNLRRDQNIQIIVRDVFAWARRLSPVIIIVDDLDMIVPARGSGYLDPVTSCFMENLDGLSSTTRIFLLVTTNRPEVVESAILDRPGRIGTKIRFEGFDACFPELLQSQAKLHGLDWNDAQMSGIGESQAYRALMSSMDVSPDIARNVMQRIALSKSKLLTRNNLAKALQATTRSFGATASAAA